MICSDGKSDSLSFFDGEPEDNNINRNFNDVYNIASMLKLAYECGKRGEEYEYEEEEEEEF